MDTKAQIEWIQSLPGFKNLTEDKSDDALTALGLDFFSVQTAYNDKFKPTTGKFLRRKAHAEALGISLPTKSKSGQIQPASFEACLKMAQEAYDRDKLDLAKMDRKALTDLSLRVAQALAKLD